MYSFKSRVRYSELDNKGFLSLEEIVNYFQDCSTFHSESIGRGLSTFSNNNLVWVLSAWQIVVKRYPQLGEEIEVCTAPYCFKGFAGNRNFWLMDIKGERIAYANSIWTLINSATGMPTRIVPSLIEGYQVEEKILMDYEPRKIARPEEDGVKVDVIIVKKHHLDTNNHVNNGQYIAIALDCVLEDVKVKQMRVEYKKSAVLEDEIHIYKSEKNGRCMIDLCNSNKESYAVVELMCF